MTPRITSAAADPQQPAAILAHAQNLLQDQNLSQDDADATRRSLILGPLVTPLLAALPLGLISAPALAINPNETQVTLPDHFQWKAWSEGPPHSSETASLFGATDKPGPYVVAIKWYPGYMSAPHMYDTDRLCFVLSGTWWVNSGANFDPGATVPVPAGGFVRRVAHTPHYDGVRKGEKSPAIIGIVGQAPINLQLIDPAKPQWRAV